MFNIFDNINYNQILISLASAVIYFLGFLGLWLLFSNSILSLFKSTYSNTRFRVSLQSSKHKRSSRLYKHIHRLLVIGYDKKKSSHVYTFYAITIIIFVISLILLSRQTSVVFTAIFSVAFALSPYFILRLKLRNIRVDGSYEAEIVITELINQYKINYFNMIEAIDRSIPFLNEAPLCQRLLFNLSMQLKVYRTEDELQEILNDFIYAIDTEWIKQLSNNIYLAVEDGINVSNGLEDILNELRQAKKNIEQTKRFNSEGFAIIKFLSPAFYIILVFCAVKYFGFTVTKFIDYQLNTTLGFRFFIIIITLTIINIAIMKVFKKQKFDFY